MKTSKKSWIFHREEIDTMQDGVCNVYLLLDDNNNHCLGQNVCEDLPDKNKIIELLNNAHEIDGNWPQQLYIAKKNPYIKIVKSICQDLSLTMTDLSPVDFKPLVKEFSHAFKRFKLENSPAEHEPLSEREEKKLEAFMPEIYGPCPCASGSKFKFCCQKGFREITYAMCAAEDGHIEKALSYMKEAQMKIGITAETMCRIAICWSFFDREKSKEYLIKALKLNPNHPRANYISGLEAVETNRYEEAMAYYQKAIENYHSEDNFHLNETYNNMGVALYSVKNYKEAKVAWEKALVLLPDDTIARDNLFEFIYKNPVISDKVKEITPFMKKFIDQKSSKQ